MTEKEEIKALSDKIDITFEAFQMLNDKAGELIESLTDRVYRLEAKVAAYETLTKDEILEKLSFSESTFYRRLHSGDIKEVLHGRYAVSRALYDKILGEPVYVRPEITPALIEATRLKIEDSSRYPSYVFRTP